MSAGNLSPRRPTHSPLQGAPAEIPRVGPRRKGPALPGRGCYDPKDRDRLIRRRQASSASASLPLPGRLPGNSVKYRHNAAMESWFSSMTFELGDRFETHAIAKAELFDY